MRWCHLHHVHNKQLCLSIVYCRLPLNSDAAKWIKHIKFMVLNGRRPGHAGLFTRTVQACSLEHVVYQGMLR